MEKTIEADISFWRKTGHFYFALTDLRTIPPPKEEIYRLLSLNEQLYQIKGLIGHYGLSASIDLGLSVP